MYKRSNKIVSTPIKRRPVKFTSSSCSISEINYNSSNDLTDKNEINIKENKFHQNYYNNKKKNKNKSNVITRKRKFSKIKSKEIPCRNKKGRKFILSETSDSELESEFVNNNLKNYSRVLKNTNTNERDKRKLTCDLFESPERIRDKKYNYEDKHLLSPSFISGISRHPLLIENSSDKENYHQEDDIVSLDHQDLKIREIDISPILTKSDRVKTYKPAKREAWKRNLLKNTASVDLYSNYQASTYSADLLWDKYMKDHADEFPKHYQDTLKRKLDTKNNEKSETDETSDTVKGSLNKKSESLPTTIDEVIYVSDDTDDSKFDQNKNRKGKWIKMKENYDYKFNDSNCSDIKEKSFNEFNAELKARNKRSNLKRSYTFRNKNQDCSSLLSTPSTSFSKYPKIKSDSFLITQKYKKDIGGNYILKINEEESS
ncbi:hypothetical protein M0802_001268 [Mischocyttarus mexicanus]|nr:hypothetical protein M0802_001268 [Mischocyttarus mexicanus]